MALLLLRIMINSLSIVIADKIIGGIVFTGEWWKMIVVGAVFGFINAFIKPVVQFFTFPFIILSLGLFTLIINTLMLSLTAALSGTFNLGFEIKGFWSAFWGAVIVSVVSMVLSWLTGLRRIRYERSPGR